MHMHARMCTHHFAPDEAKDALDAYVWMHMYGCMCTHHFAPDEAKDSLETTCQRSQALKVSK